MSQNIVRCHRDTGATETWTSRGCLTNRVNNLQNKWGKLMRDREGGKKWKKYPEQELTWPINWNVTGRCDSRTTKKNLDRYELHAAAVGWLLRCSFFFSSSFPALSFFSVLFYLIKKKLSLIKIKVTNSRSLTYKFNGPEEGITSKWKSITDY